MLTIHQALLQGTTLLEDAAVPAARLTAEVLLCHALKQERAYLYAHPEQELAEVCWIHYGRYLHERLQGKPTQYITKRQEFYGREFRVSADVLIPRPETEHLVEAALARLDQHALVLDLGTGSGAIAITLALESGARVIGSDVSLAALQVAAGNAAALTALVAWMAADLAGAVGERSLDMLVSNPPYVPQTDQAGLQREVRDWEPHVALFGGPTGLEMYSRIVEQAARVLRPGGWLLFELGYNSLEAVQNMLAPGWEELDVRHDLAGFPRVLAARLMRSHFLRRI